MTLDATSSTNPTDGTIVSYDWDVEGDGTFESSSASGLLSHLYSQRGTFSPRVRVTDNYGRSGVAVASQPVEVRLAPPPGPLGVSLNAGARYTNDPEVIISAVWPNLATEMVMSNDGGFGSAQTREVSPRTKWRLDSSGPERLPKTIYVRFVGGESGLETYQDDIILDETDPVVKSTSATVAGGGASASVRTLAATSGKKRRGKRKVILRTRAKDRTSGVSKIQVGKRKSKKLKKRKYRRKLKLRTSSRKLWVRVIDRAGNRSRWKRVKVKR